MTKTRRITFDVKCNEAITYVIVKEIKAILKENKIKTIDIKSKILDD